jgi:formylglycine-generating enzyme required for sulfatase activity
MASQVLTLLVLGILLGACTGLTATQARPSPAATPLSAPSESDTTPAIEASENGQAGMLYVPEGEYLMGSDEDSAEESPAHNVHLDAFWIDRTEVTYAQFARFLNQMGGHEVECSGHDCNEIKNGDKNSHMLVQDGSYVVETGYEDYPMSEVTWYGAQAYCGWAGKRLPTEAEWEKAARGTDGRRYPWGNSEPSCAKLNFRTCVRSTIAVGSYPAGASPYGALDMAGNVYEWTADWYDRDYYRGEAASSPNPRGPASGRSKVARGGSSYDLDLYLVRTTYRFGYVPETGHRVVGFRCVADPPPEALPPEPTAPPAAVEPVAGNDDWLPVVREFDDVPMALVPPGCFPMGSEDEQPIHEHCFDRPFWIDVTEVTNVQYGSEGQFSGIDRPRDSVDWFEAADWEYAARGPNGLPYPWGTEFVADYLFFGDNSLQQSWDVGLRPAGASWVGALNMSGNLWEWTSSLLMPYPYDGADGREATGADSQGERVLRGGSWDSYPHMLRLTNRDADGPYAALPDRGFRCVRDLEP